MMALNLNNYYQTLHIMNGSQPLWSASTFTWPNSLSLVASTVTFLSALVVLFSYSRGRHYAAKIDQKRSTVGKFVLLLEIAAALTSAIAMSKTRANVNNLSGQTCGAPDSKLPMFPQINFDKFCLM